jgi:hypothetical protein
MISKKWFPGLMALGLLAMALPIPHNANYIIAGFFFGFVSGQGFAAAALGGSHKGIGTRLRFW